MAINRGIKNVRDRVLWNGEEAATVRGLTPNDVAQLLADQGRGVHVMLEASETFTFSDIDLHNKDQVADRIMEEAPRLLVHLANHLPDFLAKLIAVAAEGDDEDADFIRDNWSLPLQYEALRKIAVQTFSGPEGFRMFVGNVLALAETVKSLTGGKTRASNELARPPSGLGTKESSTPAPS